MFVVAGSSGNTGAVVAERLLAQGQKVRALARSTTRFEKLRTLGAEVVALDLEDTAALTDALRGAQGAYLLVPPDMTSQNLLADQERVIASLRAAVSAGRPAHVVFLSSVAAQHAAGTGPIRSLHAAERELSAATENITFVRAGYFMENTASAFGGLAEGVFPSFLELDLPVEMVATRDIGAVAAGALLEGPQGRQIIELDGPRPYTAREVAATLESLLKKPVRAVELPESAIVETYVGFGMPRLTAQLYDEMTRAINSGHVSRKGGGTRHVRGSTELSQVLAGLLSK